jgi:hypothetical protein
MTHCGLGLQSPFKIQVLIAAVMKSDAAPFD